MKYLSFKKSVLPLKLNCRDHFLRRIQFVCLIVLRTPRSSSHPCILSCICNSCCWNDGITFSHLWNYFFETKRDARYKLRLTFYKFQSHQPTLLITRRGEWFFSEEISVLEKTTLKKTDFFRIRLNEIFKRERESWSERMKKRGRHANKNWWVEFPCLKFEWIFSRNLTKLMENCRKRSFLCSAN